MPYANCTDCNVTVNVTNVDVAPSCERCGAPMSWLVPPQQQAASLDDAPTLVRDTPSRSSRSNSNPLAPIDQHPIAPILSAPSQEEGPNSRPTIPLDTSDDGHVGGLLGERVTGGSGILPRETPSRMSIPSLSPPKKESVLPPTRPKSAPSNRAPTPLMILVLIVVAALTGVVLALLSP